MVKSFLWIVALVFFSGCASTAVMQRKSSRSKMAYVNPKGPIGNAEMMVEDLTRKANLNWNGDTSVELTLSTVPLLKSEAVETIKEKSYKEKWDEKDTQSTLDKEIQTAEILMAKKTCFTMAVHTDDVSARDAKTWHGELVTGAGEKLALSFSDFFGSANTLSQLSRSRYSAYRYQHTTYDMYSSVCVNKPIDLAKSFSVVLEPRFAMGIKPITLTWLEPKS